ncbi:hypothetical protein BDV28DRAFT_164120 [Aspergillus coremiiformis]|uniref:Uncharacterized protein n=1 Tax=Aspergillus coremiiformis TaxID=138285 RepID=A0A5N6ZAB7_9EURO|nr:hypothetical protein BDV28DRAFT_164120 [Aspergillus coremiiformis]
MGQILVLPFSVIILALTWASFVPQIQYVWQTKDTRGISSAYLLFNLLCITQHVFFHSLDVANIWALSKLDPPPVSVSPLDWLNIAQLSGVWILSNIFFALCLYYSHLHPPTNHRLRILLILSIYAFFLLFTLVPLILDLTTDVFCPPSHPHNCLLPERDIVPFLRGVQCFYLLPVTTVILPILGFYKQAQLQRRRRRQQQRRQQQQQHEQTITPTSTSDLNLLLARPRLFQTVIFALSAILWVFRLPPGQQQSHDPPLADPSQPAPLPRPWLPLFMDWWVFIGYLIVDDAIFAIGQGVLGYLGLRKAAAVAPAEARSQRDDDDDDAERRPLLVASEEHSIYRSES